jgi:hypothetical protein
MKRTIAIVLFLFAFNCTRTYAQVDSREFVFSLAPEVSLPMGDFKELNKTGFGGNFIAQFILAEKLRLLASLGGTMYKGKTYEIDPGYSEEYPVITTLRLRGGLKYYLSQAFFVAGNLGIANVNQDGEKKLALSYAPQIGIELGGVDIFAKYDVANVKTANGGNVNALGFCLGYRF